MESLVTSYVPHYTYTRIVIILTRLELEYLLDKEEINCLRDKKDIPTLLYYRS